MLSWDEEFVRGYFSYDRNTVKRIARGKYQPRPNCNSVCWFDRGYYYWTDSLAARREAINRARDGDIKIPAVMGVYIYVGRRLNLSRPILLSKAHSQYLDLKKYLNEGLSWGSAAGRRGGRCRFDTVFCPVIDEFGEDGIEQLGQIWVNDPEQVVGHFLPDPIELFNSWLDE